MTYYNYALWNHQATIATPHDIWRNKRLYLFGFYEMCCQNSSAYWFLGFSQLKWFILHTSLVSRRKNMVQRMKKDERPMRCNSGHAVDDPLEKSLNSLHIQEGSRRVDKTSTLSPFILWRVASLLIPQKNSLHHSYISKKHRFVETIRKLWKQRTASTVRTKFPDPVNSLTTSSAPTLS